MLVAALPVVAWTAIVDGEPALAGATGLQASDHVSSESPRRHGRVLRVGHARALHTIADAAREARDGDTVEIDAGTYSGDVAIWPQNDLTIRAVGGRAFLNADGKSAEGKAIWVIKGSAVTIENVAFAGTRVPSRNGAGIRHEGGKLVVRRCLFEHNEMGLLTWNSPSSELDVEASEFRYNGVADTHRPGEPIGHQIYVGTIRRFALTASYVHGGAFGHLVKSRATVSRIEYNRLTDERAGRASYELEFPNGGLAYVIGNIIQQSVLTENEALVSFGAEGYRWADNRLLLVNNTLVDDLPRGGVFVRVLPGADDFIAYNNLFVGEAALPDAPGRPAGNFKIARDGLTSIADNDFRLRRNASPAGRAVDPGAAEGVALRPSREYRHPLKSATVKGFPYSPGALQSLAR